MFGFRKKRLDDVLIGKISAFIDRTFVDEDAIKTLSNVYCHKMFFGADGFDPEYGMTCGSMEEAEITRQMMKSSRQCIMLCDSSKLGKKGFARISGMDEVDVLITDSGLPEKTKEDLEALGVKVLLV